MSRYLHPDIHDKGLEEIPTNANLLIACKGFPLSREEAVNTYHLASVAMNPADFVLEDAPSGRRCRVGTKNNVPIVSQGLVNHAALVDGTRLLAVTEMSPQQYYAGNFVNMPSFSITKNNPT